MRTQGSPGASIRRRLAMITLILVGAGSVGISTTTPATAADSCSTVIGMSQIRNMYQGSDLVQLGSGWELNWSPGTRLGNWANPDDRMWDDIRQENDCGDPIRAYFGFDPTPVMRIDGYSGSNQEQLDDLIDSALINIRAQWPSIETIDISILIGGEDDAICEVAGRVVRPTQLHRDVYPGVVDYLLRHPEIGGGWDFEVPCSGFADWIGHLNDEGKVAAGDQLETALAVEDPTTTTTMPTTTSSTDEPTTTSTVATTTTTTPEPTTAGLEASYTFSVDVETLKIEYPATWSAHEPDVEAFVLDVLDSTIALHIDSGAIQITSESETYTFGN